jgi:opacity protein-like surface antigen
MKKKMLTIACCATLLSISTIAYSAEGPYVSGNLGFANANDADATDLWGDTGTFESDTGLALGFAIGNDLGNGRIEGEIAYQKNDLDKLSIPGDSADINGDTSSTAFLLNGYYDFKNGSSVTPFISAGLGFANIEVSDISAPGVGTVTTSSDDQVFAYQIGAGVGIAVNEKVSIDLKYPDFGLIEAEYSSHNMYAGVRVSF